MMWPLIFTVLLTFAAQHAAAIWPHPTYISQGYTSRSLDPSEVKLISDVRLPKDVRGAFSRTMDNIARYSVQGSSQAAQSTQRGSPVTEVHIKIEPWQKHTSKRHAHQSHVKSNRQSTRDKTTDIAFEATQKLEDLDEQYVLRVPKEGEIVIRAASALGILRGLTTLEHLVYRKGQHGFVLPNVPLQIKDEPAWPYRGLLIDTARHYYPIAALKHQMDAMTFVKMNQFHWHIVDSQSFPLQLPGDLAKLSEAGAYSPQQTYSPDEIKDLVQYAAERGININVEIDMPGHTYAGVNAYDPSLLACPNQSPWSVYGNEPPTGQLDIRKKKAAVYAKKLLSAVAQIFPGPYISTGNDEVNLACYNANKTADIDTSLLKPFVTAAHSVLHEHGKTPMVWEEAALDFPETGKALLPGTIVEAWTTPDNVAAILASNDKVKLLHAPYTHFYLDCGRGSWLTNATGASWCEHVSWSKMYTFDPTDGTKQDNVERVIGGEAALWSEQSDAANADSLIWPRSAAAAEVFWTGKYMTSWKESSISAGEPSSQSPLHPGRASKKEEREGGMSQRSLIEATPRINELRERLVARGVRATPVQPRWCINNPESCLAPV